MINELWTKWQLWPKNVISQIFQSLYNFISTLVINRAKCNTDDERYYDPQCFTFEGSGDELITPQYNPPPRPPQWKEDPSDINICDDDEECGEFGSGTYFEGIKKISQKYSIILETFWKVDQS